MNLYGACKRGVLSMSSHPSMMMMKWPGDITDLYIAWQCLGEQIKQFMKSKAKLTGVEAVSLQDR